MSVHTQDQMRLSIARPPDSSVECVQIQGDVDLSDCRALGLAARHLIDGDASTIYVDLGGVTFMGSNLVGFLVQVGNAVSDARRHLVLCRPRPMVRKVIHLNGLELFASVYPDLPNFWPHIALVDPAASLSALALNRYPAVAPIPVVCSLTATNVPLEA
jgi:anti-anti-sigma factor